MASKIKVRKNALNLPTWDPAIEWYAKAVGAMRKLPLKNPLSWSYQAARHGFALNSGDPLVTALWTKLSQGQTLPSKADQKTYWEQCQHQTWYFLPWHRMYLGYFEQIVRKVVVGLGGPADWTLPYWDYNAGPGSLVLPTAFTQPSMPDGTPNPLFEPERARGNDGKAFTIEKHVNPAAALKESKFAGAVHGGTAGFGGPVTIFSHSGETSGLLENQPHNNVHVDVGGLMGDPDSAAYDPIFYVHHANIDRLWAIWAASSAADVNPSDTTWRNFTFHFHDASGKGVTLKPKDVLVSTGAPFYYEYDDLSTPSAAAVKPSSAVKKTKAQSLKADALMSEEAIPEMVGASSNPTPLTSGATTMSVKLFPVTGPALRSAAARSAPFQKAYLHVENVRGKGRPDSYDVYLNVPEKAAEMEKYLVGAISPFGITQASEGKAGHPGNGLGFTFDVTDAVNLLQSENRWDPSTLKVTFKPAALPAKGSGNGPAPYIEVGRVSLYFA